MQSRDLGVPAPAALPDNLPDIRAAIDAIDDGIVTRLVEREQLVRRAAAFKHSDAEVIAPERAAAVPRRARALAEARGGSGDAVEAIYREVVRAFTALEMTHRDASTAPGPDTDDNEPPQAGTEQTR